MIEAPSNPLSLYLLKLVVSVVRERAREFYRYYCIILKSEHSFLLEMASSYYFEKTPVRRFLSVHHPKEDSSSDEDETESGVALESQPKDATNKGKPQIVRGNFQPFSL